MALEQQSARTTFFTLGWASPRVVTWLVIAVVLGLFIRLGYVVADGFRDPFIVHSVRVLTPVVHANEVIRVTYDTERVRYCTTNIAEFWIDRTTGRALTRARIPGGYSALGRRTALVTLSPPANLPPGQYTYRSFFDSDCGMTNYTYPIPDADFDVVAEADQ